MDFTKHQLMPKHLKVSDAEKAVLCKEFKVQLIDFPKILRKDQGIATLHVKAGDIIRIVRESKTAGTTNYYRVVVDG